MSAMTSTNEHKLYRFAIEASINHVDKGSIWDKFVARGQTMVNDRSKVNSTSAIELQLKFKKVEKKELPPSIKLSRSEDKFLPSSRPAWQRTWHSENIEYLVEVTTDSSWYKRFGPLYEYGFQTYDATEEEAVSLAIRPVKSKKHLFYLINGYIFEKFDKEKGTLLGFVDAEEKELHLADFLIHGLEVCPDKYQGPVLLAFWLASVLISMEEAARHTPTLPGDDGYY